MSLELCIGRKANRKLMFCYAFPVRSSFAQLNMATLQKVTASRTCLPQQRLNGVEESSAKTYPLPIRVAHPSRPSIDFLDDRYFELLKRCGYEGRYLQHSPFGSH